MPSQYAVTPQFIEEWSRQFDYNRSSALDLRELGVEDRDGIAVHDMTFAAPLRSKIPAYLVMPPGAGPFAGILFAHWFDPGAPDNNRTQFLDEAVAFARAGALSILVDGLFPWRGSPSANDARYDRRHIVQHVIELRRALDLLVSRPGVDAERLGFVGHDFNAMYGTLLAGVDKRLKAGVCMAGTPRFSDWFLQYWPSYLDDEARTDYLHSLEVVDPIHYAGRATPAALFFQFARHDRFVSEADALAYYAAANEPKHIAWYDAEHHLNEVARHDRRQWLGAQLGLAG